MARPLTCLDSWRGCRKFQTEEGFEISRDFYSPDRVGHVAMSVMDELFVWGGYHDRSIGSIYLPCKTVWVYILDYDKWQRYEPYGQCPPYMSGACSAVVWPHWYILCGHCESGHLNHVYRLNLMTCAWECISRPNYFDNVCLARHISPRDKTVCWVDNRKIYVFGGYGTYPYNYLWDDVADRYNNESHEEKGWNNQLLAFNTTTSRWEMVDTQGSKPISRAAHTATKIGNAVYIFGGRSGPRRMNDLHRFDLTEYKWSGKLFCKGVGPCGRSWHTMTPISDVDLILYGGFNTDSEVLDDLWQLTVNSLTWTCLRRSTGHFRLWHTACSNTSGDVLIFGGCTNNILDDYVSMEASDHVLTVRLKPYTLERLCLHALWRERYPTQQLWENLTRRSQEWLQGRREAHSEGRSVYMCTATAVYGPSLRQLNVLQPEEAEFVNRNNVQAMINRYRHFLNQPNDENS